MSAQTAANIQNKKKMSIDDRLKRIEELTVLAAKDVFNTNDAALYLGISKQYLYRLVFLRKIPFYKGAGGKLTYFAKSELNEWMLHRRVQTQEEQEQAAIAHVINNPIGGRVRKGGAK